MGVEHALMDKQWNYAVGTLRVTNRLSFASESKHDSPNHRGLRRAVWCLEAALANDEKAWNDAVTRALEYFNDMREWGHMSDGENGRTEIFTASHRQLWYALMAAFLWAAQLALAKRWQKSSSLLREAVEFWQLEAAVARRCHFIDTQRKPRLEQRTVLVPGARMGEPGKPFNTNATTDEVIFALIDGWQQPPKTPKVGSYSAAIPLLKKAFAAGVDILELTAGDDSAMTREASASRIPKRVGWRLKGSATSAPGDAPGDFYSWFTDLGFVYHELNGAGYVNGQIVLKWDRDEAVAYGEALELSAKEGDNAEG